MNNYYVYILANKRNGTLYIGMTNNLKRRIFEHRSNLIDGFTKKYSIHKLVFFEIYQDVNTAITREKRIKEWKREWKLKLIEDFNPLWEDLFDKISL
jgi:putative endonuclease